MKQKNLVTIDDRLEARLVQLRLVLAELEVSNLPIAPIAFLTKLLLSDELKGLKFEREVEPTSPTAPGSASSVPSMEISVTQRERVYRISKRTRAAMEKVAVDRGLDDQAVDWMIDNYFVHELLHFAQGMAGGNHSGLSAQAPQVLLAIDYQADAIAAVTATVLAWCRPELYGFASATSKDNHWTLYVTAIKAILHQMEVFTLLSRRDMNRTEISSMRSSLERIQRISTWHYQLHRAEQFNARRPLADFQILAQPILDFRNLAWAAVLKPDALKRDWPQQEQTLYSEWASAAGDKKGNMFALDERPPLIITGVTPYGTTRFVRHNAATRAQYDLAFQGIFDNEPRASRDFFTTLFPNNTWLVGGDGQSPPGWGWDDPPDPPPDLPDLTGGLAQNQPEDRRMTILSEMMMPSRFPLTVLTV